MLNKCCLSQGRLGEDSRYISDIPVETPKICLHNVLGTMLDCRYKGQKQKKINNFFKFIVQTRRDGNAKRVK